jgi:PAS domain S-box-containing protein
MKDGIKTNLLGYGKYLVILVICIATGYTLLYVTYENVKQKMIANLNERQFSHGKQAAKGIETFFQDQVSSLQQMAKDEHIVNLDAHGISLIRSYYEARMSEVSVVTRIDGRGRILFAMPFDPKVINQPVVSMDDFMAVKQTHKAWISDVYTNRRGFKTIKVQVPVLEHGSFKGTVAVLLPFDAIAKRFVEDIKIGENGYAWVVSKEGVELSCPVPGHVGNSVFKNCRDFPDILAMARRMTRGEQGITSYQFNRVRGDVVEKTVKHAVYLPVRLENTFWSIVIATPEDEVISGLRDFRNRLMLIAVLLLTVVGGLSYMVFRNQILLREVMRRKKTEEVMFAKTEELDRYFTNSLDLLCIADLEGNFRRLNPEWEKALGYSVSELIGRRFYEFIHPDDQAPTREAVAALAKKNKVLNFVNRYRHQDGTYRWIEWRAYPVENMIYAVARDITLRKQIEEELKESQRRLADIIEFLPDATFVIDKNGTITAWNKAIADMTGAKAKEMVGKGDYEYTLPFYGERRPALIDMLLKPDAMFLNNEYKGFLKLEDTLSAEVFSPLIKQGQGGYIWVTATKLYGTGGEVVGAIESIRDVSEYRAMNDALRASELRFKELSDLLPEAIFETDKNMTIRFVNQKAVSLFGYSENEIDAGLNALDIIVQADQARARENIIKRMTGEFEGPVEYTAEKKDGTTFPVLINMVPVMKEGSPVGFRGVIIDITERKRTEEQVRLQAMVLDQIQDRVTVTDLHGNITYVNESEIASLGYPKEELIGRNVSFYGEDANKGARQLEIIEKTLAKGFWRGEVVNYDRQGREIILDCRTQVVYDETGNPVAMAGIATDITEKKHLERALEENRVDLRMVVDATDDQILLTDAEGVILLYNRVLGEGYKNISNNLVGHNIFDLMSNDCREARWRYFEGARKAAAPCFFEDESEGRTWSSAAYPVINASGDVNRMVLFGRDITERKVADRKQKELEERLQRAEKMEALGLLSGGVAHDLNNILGVVLGYSELLVGRIKEASPVKTYAVKIMESSERAAAVIQDMLTLARRGVQNRCTLNISELIREFLKTPEFQNITMLHPKVQMKTQLDTKPLYILGAPSQLDKTIMNLVANAAEAMPRGGFITITTANRYLDRPLSGYDEISEGDYVVLSVSDTGEGISEKDIKHIFEPFYTRKAMGKSGTGLGLSVVWGAVKDHNGYINVDSEVGVGTTFSLYFPVTREEMAEKKQAVSIADYLGKGESILVVDDVESQRELVQRMLEQLKYQVAIVSSGEQAVEYLKDHRVDLVVLDMIMDPGMDGLDTYKKIIEIHPQQKAIIVSGFAETERVRQLQALGGGEYVMKPYMMETLGLAVKRELERMPRQARL